MDLTSNIVCEIPGCTSYAVADIELYLPPYRWRSILKVCESHRVSYERRQTLARERMVKREAERAERKRKSDEEYAARRDEEQRRLAADIERGSPGRMSPAAVVQDPRFEHVASVDGCTYPASIQRVVKNKALGTLWSARFAIRDDDSDADNETGWTEVEACQVTTTVYEPVKR